MFLLIVSILSVMSKDTGEVKTDEEVAMVRSTLLQQVRKETASSSSSSADPEPKKPRKLHELFDAGQLQMSPFDNPVTLLDVLPQIQAGSDATKLHPQTPFTAYVPSYSTIIVIAMVHFCHVFRSFRHALDPCTHSNVWFDERMNV